MLVILACLGGIFYPHLLYEEDFYFQYDPETPQIPKIIDFRINRLTGEVQELTANGWKTRTEPIPEKNPFIDSPI